MSWANAHDGPRAAATIPVFCRRAGSRVAACRGVRPSTGHVDAPTGRHRRTPRVFAPAASRGSSRPIDDPAGEGCHTRTCDSKRIFLSGGGEVGAGRRLANLVRSGRKQPQRAPLGSLSSLSPLPTPSWLLLRLRHGRRRRRRVRHRWRAVAGPCAERDEDRYPEQEQHRPPSRHARQPSQRIALGKARADSHAMSARIIPAALPADKTAEPVQPPREPVARGIGRKGKMPTTPSRRAKGSGRSRSRFGCLTSGPPQAARLARRRRSDDTRVRRPGPDAPPPSPPGKRPAPRRLQPPSPGAAGHALLQREAQAGDVVAAAARFGVVLRPVQDRRQERSAIAVDMARGRA
jgi:hypothetical protein